MSSPLWLARALHDHRLTPRQRLVLVELKRLATGGHGDGKIKDLAQALDMDRLTVLAAILRLQHLNAIDLVLRDTRAATGWFEFGVAERVPA